MKARLLPCTLLSLFVLVNLFLWTYLPQVLFLLFFHKYSGSAWINGTVLVLSESALVVALLFEAFFVDETQVDIFDSVLVAKGQADLVSVSRPVLPETGTAADGSPLNPRTRLERPTRRAIYAPFSFRQIAEFVLLLPLNLVPFIGVPMFLILTGYRAGPLIQWRYFALKGMDRKARHKYVDSKRWEYTWFGTMYLILQLIPVLSMFFLLTSAAGSALWAAEQEEEAKRASERNGFHAASPEEQYARYRDAEEQEEDDPV
jgi:Na+(H+)/acetate symporter ActP